MTNEELNTNIIRLLEMSESRIDRTNEMIANLTESCKTNQEMYDKHMTNAEQSRDQAQKNLNDLIHMHNQVRADYREMLNNMQRVIDGYKEELHSAKNRIIMMETELAHIAETKSSKLEVNIDSKNK